MNFLKHLAGYLPVSLATALGSFAAVFFYTRILSPEEFGAFSLMFWVMTVIHTLTLTWVEASNYRFAAAAEGSGETANHYATALKLMWRSILISLVLTALVYVFVRDEPSYVMTLPWIAALLPLDAIIKIALEGHRAGQRVRRYVTTETARIVIGFVIGAMVAWQIGLGPAAPFVGLVTASALLAAREWPFLSRSAKGGVVSNAAPREWLGYGLPVAFALVLDLILSGIDRPMLAILSPRGNVAVAEYAAGYGVADKTVLLICAWAATAASPLVLAAFERGGREAARIEARSLIRTLLMLGVPAAMGVALIARPLGEVMIGEALREQAIKIIPWIAFSGLLNGLLIYYFADAFSVVKKTGERALLMMVPAGAKIALNLMLIPAFDLMGAVYATVASYALGILVLGFAVRRHFPLPLPWTEGLKVAFAAAAMIPALNLIPDMGSWAELILKTVTGGVVYIALAFALDAGGARGFVMAQLKKSRNPSGA